MMNGTVLSTTSETPVEILLNPFAWAVRSMLGAKPLDSGNVLGNFSVGVHEEGS